MEEETTVFSPGVYRNTNFCVASIVVGPADKKMADVVLGKTNKHNIFS